MQNLPNWMRIVIFTILLSITIIIIYLLETDQMPLEIQIVVLTVGTFYGSYRFVRYRKRMHASRMKQTLESYNVKNIPPTETILYLRPFKVDSKKTEPISFDDETFISIESLLGKMLERHGTPIAIGKPFEKLQPLGTKRIYADNDEWKNVVSYYLSSAKFVVLYVEFTPGVKWEIQKVINENLDKVILVPKLFNLRSGLLKYSFFFLPLLVLYPFYHIYARSFLFNRIRRRSIYYQQWDQSINHPTTDRVAAIAFEDGKPNFYTSVDSSIEAQINAIICAIKDKVGRRN